MNLRRYMLLGVLCLQFGGCAAVSNVVGSVAEKREPTIGSLSRERVQLEDDQSIKDGSQKAAATYREALASAANPRMEAEALRRLADLELEFAEEALIENENPPSGNEFNDAIALYQSVLARYDESSGRDKVRYQLARAQENAGREADALATLDELVANHADSPYRDEAQFRRGEMLFRARQYAAAEDAYAEVIAAGSSGNFYSAALYKHGWAQFKQSLHEESLASFFDLLDHKLVVADQLQSVDMLGKAQRELVEDSLRAVSISLSYFPQAADVYAWLAARNPPYLPRVYTSLADLYVAQERYDDAARTLTAFVQAQPMHPQAPAFQLRVIDTWRTARFASRELEAREAFVASYVPDAPYWSVNDAASSAEVLQAVSKHLGDLAGHYHAAFQGLTANEKNREARDHSAARAVQYYAQSLQHFPALESAGQHSFMMAELLFEVQRFAEAASAYERAAYASEQFDRRAEAGYAALLAYAEQEKGLPAGERDTVHQLGVQSALRFAEAFPAHAEVEAVLLSVAEDAFARGKYEDAIGYAERVLAAEPDENKDKDKDLRNSALLVAGHARFEIGAFAAAETSYIEVLTLLAADDPRRPAIVEKQAAAIYKQGEVAREEGAFANAAQAFARAAEAVPGSEMAAVAQYDAADMLLQVESWSGAAAALQEFIARFPNHELTGDARRRLVGAHDGGGDQVAAAMALLELAEASSDESEREAGLWQGAERLAAAGKHAMAINAFENYLSRYDHRFDAAMEARHQLLLLHEKLGNDADTNRVQREILAAHKGAGEAATSRSHTLAANAAIALAQPAIDQYQSVKLKAPLAKALRKKKARMEVALAALTEAADFQILEVTTHATFEIAALYNHMASALYASERPRKLNDEELEQYELLLEEQAFPFEEKAIGLHEANIARLRDGAYDQWLQASMDALSVLMPARYARKETSEDAVVQIH